MTKTTINKQANTSYNKRSSKCDEDNNKYTNLNEIRSLLERTARNTTEAVNEIGREGIQLFLAGKIESKCTNLIINCGSCISLISCSFYHQLSKKGLQNYFNSKVTKSKSAAITSVRKSKTEYQHTWYFKQRRQI